NMREIEHMCDRIAFLAHGEIVAQGTPQEVIDRAHTASLEEVFIRIARNGRQQDVVETRECN
ncbi:MAG TPA: ABC transporter ATP-binding protein, partial [Candidatus Tectomicrobia bacterium]